MHRAPQEEDTQPDKFSLPSQRRRRRAISERSTSEPSPYFDDEHPEIPLVRRATRHLEPDEPEPTTSQNALRYRRQAPPAVKLAPPSAYRSYDEEDEVETNGTRPDLEAHPTRPILVARRRRPAVYEPPTVPYRSRGGSSKPSRRLRSRSGKLQELLRNPTFLVISGISLALLILLPLAASAVVNLALHPTGIFFNSANAMNMGNTQLPAAQDPGQHQVVITPPNNGHPAPPVYATSAYLLDADTGATLYARNPFVRLPLMSTTKLMTAILAAEMGSPDQKVTITPAIMSDIDKLSADSALMGVKKGETYTLRDLLYGLLLVSGNDAGVAIADTLAGSIPAFAAKMNERAAQLKMFDTHFLNPHGLMMTNHYSSAHDLALLGKYSLSLPLIHEIANSKHYHMDKSASHPAFDLVNGNQFLWWYPGVDGGKTGWDGDTNFIQVMSVTRNGHHLIGVVMHTIDWWTDMRDLMNYGFSSYSWVSPYDADISNPPIPFDYEWNYFARDKKDNTIPLSNKGRYYIYSGYSLSNPILEYYDKNGGLKHFGYPTAQPQLSNDQITSQQFEHATIQCNMTSKACSSA